MSDKSHLLQEIQNVNVVYCLTVMDILHVFLPNLFQHKAT